MSTDLTREQACDKFIADNQFRMVAPSTKMQSADSFRAGWSARDAEVERLRAALRQAEKDIRYIKRFSADKAHVECESDIAINSIQNILQAALAEPK